MTLFRRENSDGGRIVITVSSMGRYGKPISVLLLLAYVTVSGVVAAGGPRVLCFADTGHVCVMDQPATDYCPDEALTRQAGTGAAAVSPSLPDGRCDRCFDVSLPSISDQVPHSTVAADHALHVDFTAPADLAALHAATSVDLALCNASPGPSALEQPAARLSTVVLRC